MEQGNTKKIRSMRIEDGLWEPALDKARGQGRSLTSVVEELLARWLRTSQRPAPQVETSEEKA